MAYNKTKDMKPAEEILENTMCCTIEEDADLDVKSNYYYQHDDVVKAIEQAQREAYNEALIDAAMLGKVEHAMVQSGDHPVYEYRIDRRSIMKLKKEL